MLTQCQCQVAFVRQRRVRQFRRVALVLVRVEELAVDHANGACL